MIRKVPGRSFGETFGNIFQAVKAHDFRGEEIKLAAAARVEDGTGYLWLSIKAGPGGTDTFHQELITSDKWQEYHIEAEVPDGASKITYGLAYVGQGTAFIDAVSIEKAN